MTHPSLHSPSSSPNVDQAPDSLAIFGATRGVGRAILEHALEAGLRVTALVRDPARLSVRHPNLSLVVGDVMDEDAVARTLEGADAVMCALGAPALSRSRVRSEGTEVIVRAMKRRRVDRLICLSVLGASETRASLPFFLRYVVFPTYLRRPVEDHERQEAVVEESGLEWTVVRPPTLTDGERTGNYVHGFEGGFERLTLDVSRADVADFMLRQLRSKDYVHRAAGISYARP